MTAKSDELHWTKDTCFHEFGDAQIETSGLGDDGFRIMIQGGRAANKSDQRHGAEDFPAVMLLASALSCQPDGPPVFMRADEARAMADALIKAAKQAELEFAQEGISGTAGFTIDAIMQRRARAFRRTN